MAEKNKNNFVVNDKTYVKKPEIHYSYKFQPYIKDLGGSPGKNITQEDRNKRLKHENNVNAVRNVVKGLNKTFGKAISGASAFYGGGWALNRLLHLNKPSTLGQFFGRYVLPANTADNVSDGVELIFDPSVEGAVDLGSGVVLGRFKDLSKPVRQVGELIGQGANINNMKNGGLIRKMQTAAGGPIYSTIEKSDNTRVSYNPIIEMSKRKGLIGTLAGILLLTEHDEAKEKRKLEEANQKRLKRRKELEDKVNAQKKHSLSSSSLINAANDLQYMDTPEGQELAKMNREDEANESAYIASLPWWKKGMFYANKLVNAGFIPVGGGTTGIAAAKTPQQTLSGFISKFGEPGNLERTVNNIILENEHWLPKETGMFAQKHSSVGSSYRKIFEELWGKENTDRLTDDLLGKLILIRNHLIDTNIPLKGDFVYVVDGQAKAYRNGLEIGYLSNSYINNGKALHPEMVKKQGTNNAGVSELLYNGTILAENRPIISGSRLLMPEVTTHIWSKYPTRKLISTEGVHAWPLRTAQERGIKLNYEKNWHTLPEFSKLHQLALDENIRTNLTGLPIYELSEPSYLPMVKNARVFDISLLRDGYINLDFTPGFAYKQGGKMNILELFKRGGQIRKMLTAAGGPLRIKFTPEQIALFESQATRVLGMNNSGGNRYREEGVLALLHLEQEAKRKEEEIKSRMEMRPTLKRKITTAEKIRGKKDEYELKPQIVGMSGADPLLSFYVGGIGLNGIGALAKTGLWNIAKYAPTTLLGNWGRGYFVGNTFKNSFNGTVPTLTSLLTSKNLSHNAPIYERVSYSKYSADAANPKERDLVIQHFKSRYPNSGLQVTSPLKISGFTYDNLLKVGELPLSEEGKAIADVMARRMKNYKLREGLDPNIVHFGLNRFSMSGINGMMNQIKNDKTIAYMPLKNSDNYGGLYEGGEALLKLNPWREKPYIYSLIHEGVSHMTDDFVKDLRTPVSGKKLLSDLSRNFNGTKTSDSMYGRISYPNDIYDEKLIEKILHRDSMKSIESRSTNWEMITNLYKMLSKEKGISYKLATELPDSEFGAFVEKILDSPEKLSKFMEKFDNQYLLDYSNLMKAGTKELANQFYKRIKGMLKYGPSLITGGYFLTSQKQGGKMNILEFLKNGSGIHIKKKNRGKFTSYCGGKVTDKCILKGKNSSNPAIRKRATFAANARKWKHLEGGTIINQSPIVAQYMLWLLNLPYLLNLLRELNLQKKMLDLLEKLLKMETTNSIFNTISNLGTTFLSNYLNKKNGAPSNGNT